MEGIRNLHKSEKKITGSRQEVSTDNHYIQILNLPLNGSVHTHSLVQRNSGFNGKSYFRNL